MRVAILWQSMSGYFAACLRALASIPGVEICLAHRVSQPDAPFGPGYSSWIDLQHCWERAPDTGRLDVMLDHFEPDAVLVSSWNVRGYRAAIRHLRNRPVRVLCMDNQWLGTPKQWLGRLISRQFIKPLYDIAFVPGDRQAAFACRLGFARSHIMRGLYCADTGAFTPPADRLGVANERAFLFVGRLVEHKGVSVLLDAYTRYRALTSEPWPLRIAGAGPLLDKVSNTPGVETLGFVQPETLPKLMWACTSLILPSLFEPWGVVVHEATIAGLIPICTDRVGAAVHLVQDGYNGYIVPAANPNRLALTMGRVASRSDIELERMRHSSQLMSMQLTTARWARYLLDALVAQRDLTGEG